MTDATRCDFLVVGAGIAGASIGFELARRGRVVLAERETQPGYHTTGRSAAQYAASYGNPLARRLTLASKPFFDAPPAGFAEHPLLTPRGVLYVAGPEQEAALAGIRAAAVEGRARVEDLDGAGACARVPVLRATAVSRALYDPGSLDVDVHALHQGYLKGLRAAGGRLVCKAEAVAVGRDGGLWRIDTPAGRFAAPVLVNAAGAWGDEVARLAGVVPLGLKPRRRTVISFDPPAGVDPAGWPFVVSADETVYFKPDAGRILASPADETDSPPCDARPEELDIAVTVDRLERLTTLAPRRIVHSWAGLRTFAPDRSVVAGFDAGAAGFFWLVGQGGTGIQMAPALARAAAALACGEALPADIAGHGVGADDLSPARLSA